MSRKGNQIDNNVKIPYYVTLMIDKITSKAKLAIINRIQKENTIIFEMVARITLAYNNS